MLITQVKRLGKSAVIYGLGTILNQFISFLLLPLFTSYLSPTDYGINTILQMVAMVVTPIFALGLSAGIGPIYFENGKEERKQATIWTTFFLLLISGTLLALVALLLPKQISFLAFQNEGYPYLVQLILFTTVISNLATPFALRLQFEEKALRFIIVTAISTIFSIAASVFMVVYLKRGITGLIEARMLGQILNLILFMAMVIRDTKFKLDFKLSKEMLRLSLPFVPSFAFLFLITQSNKYLLQWMDGLALVGIYGISYSFGQIMTILVTAFQNAWYPYFMSFLEKKEEAKVIFGRMATFYVVGFGAVSLMFYAFSRPAVWIMTQSEFHMAYQGVGFIATSQFLMGIWSILLVPIYFSKETKFISIVLSLASVGSVLVNWVLIHFFNYVGAALGLAFSVFLMDFFLYIVNRVQKQFIRIQYERKRLVTFAAFYILVVMVSMLPHNFSLPFEIMISVITAVAVLAVVFLLFMSVHERTQILGYVRQMRSLGLKQIIFQISGKANQV